MWSFSAGFVWAVLLCFAHAGEIKLKGMTYTGDRYCKEVPYDEPLSEASLNHLASTGCNMVSIVVTWYQVMTGSHKVFPIYRPFQSADNGGFWNYTFVSETPNAVKIAIRQAKAAGMDVMLKPHIDLTNDGNGTLWRGQISWNTEWFESYSNMMLMWAQLAQHEGVAMLCIATELMGVTPWHENEWRTLITRIRKVFDGKLTLAANWAPPGGSGEVTLVPFWDALDYIGADEYFQVSGSTVEEIMTSWGPLIDQFKKLHDKFEKPFILTEVGYCVGRNCQVDRHTPPGGEDTQAKHFEALLRLIEANSDWFHGVFWWNWVSDDTFNEHEWGQCMDPKWKQAEQVLRQYYNATKPQPKPIEDVDRPRCLCTL